MKKKGLSDTTIETAILYLRRISKQCNIDDPEQVKTYLALMNAKTSTKQNITQIVTQYYKYKKITWQEPEYKREQTTYYIPTETEIDNLIASARIKMATLLQTLKETGARIGELRQLNWTDLDLERRLIAINHAEKHSNNRILPISPKLQAMFNQLPKANEKVFNTNPHSLRTAFESLRNSTANKLGNPRIKQIHFHTFRHFKGTMEYHKTKDIIHVKTILGHKKIESTMIYINLENAIFPEDSDEYTCKTASNIKEATDLIEHGFQYITDIDGLKLFRKRK